MLIFSADELFNWTETYWINLSMDIPEKTQSKPNMQWKQVFLSRLLQEFSLLLHKWWGNMVNWSKNSKLALSWCCGRTFTARCTCLSGAMHHSEATAPFPYGPSAVRREGKGLTWPCRAQGWEGCGNEPIPPCERALQSCRQHKATAF